MLIAAGAQASPELIAKCEPAIVERGGHVRCSVRLEPAAPYLLISRSAESGKHKESESLHEIHAAGEEAIWEGPAIASSKVAFAARSEDVALHAEADFQVAPRKLPRLLLADPDRSCAIDRAAEVLKDPPELAKGGTPEEPLPALGALSRVHLTLPSPDWQLVEQGPNKNWYFVRAVSEKPAQLGITLTRVLEEGAPFRLAQHGDRTLPTREGGLWPHCRKIDLERLRKALWEGEGCAGETEDSRTRRVQALLKNQLDVNSELEKMVHPLDPRARENLFIGAITRRLRELEATALDAEEAKAPDVKLVCRLRYP